MTNSIDSGEFFLQNLTALYLKKDKNTVENGDCLWLANA